MKRKLLSFVLAAALLLLPGCTAAGPTGEAFALQKGVDLTTRMGQLAQNDDYVSLMSASSTLTDALSALKGDYSAPTGALLVTVTQADVSSLFQTLGGPTLSSEVLALKLPQLLSSVSNTWITKSSGVAYLAAANTLQIRMAYQAPQGWTDHALLLLTYDGGNDALITLALNEQGLLEVTATLVPVPEGMENTPQGLQSSLTSWTGLPADKAKVFSQAELQGLLK